MWIKVEDSNISKLINTDLCSQLHVQRSKKFNNSCIIATMEEKTTPLTSYEKHSTALSALDLIYEAMEDGCDYYKLPIDGDPCLSYADGIIHRTQSTRKPKTNGKTK